MNNNGQVIFYTFMVAICVIILALAFAPVLKQVTEQARGLNDEGIGLDCNNASISMFNKVSCISSDVSLFGFIIGLIFLAGIIIGAKVLME
jgi:hypothetical protein